MLHGGADGFQSTLSDVDFVVDHLSFVNLPALIDEYCTLSGWQLCQILRHETTAAYHVCSAVDDPACAVALDACSDYQRNGSTFLSAEELLGGRETLPWGGHGLSPVTELRYRFVKAAAKNKDYLTSTAEFAIYPKAVREDCSTWLLTQWNISLTSWDATDVSLALEALKKKSNARPSIFQTGAISRIISRIRRPTGLLVITGKDDPGITASRLEQIFGHLYFRSIRKAQQFRTVHLRDLVTSTLVFVPELTSPLSVIVPPTCRYYLNPASDTDTQCRALAAQLHQRCQQREAFSR